MTTPTRRELNRVRTDQAITDAVHALAQRGALAACTADDVAHEAGVSRRTFFNYFPGGVDAVVTDAIAEALHELGERFADRPDDEDVWSAIRATCAQGLPSDLLRWVAVLCGDAQGPPPEKSTIWQHHATWLATVLAPRLGRDPHELVVISLARTVLALFDAAAQGWFERTGASTEPASLQVLHELLDECFSYAATGWQLP